MSLAGTTGVLEGMTESPRAPGGIAAAAQAAAAALCAAGAVAAVPRPVHLPAGRAGPGRIAVRQAARHRRGRSAFVGLGNYAKVLADPAFRQAALNNLVYALGTLIPTLVLALAFALAVQRSTPLHRRCCARSSSSPRWCRWSRRPRCSSSSSCRASGCSTTTSPSSASAAPNWLGDPDIALWSVIGLTVWKNAGYYMLFYLAGLQNVPRDTHRGGDDRRRQRLAAAALRHPAGARADHRPSWS